jgi:hypothetical protein
VNQFLSQVEAAETGVLVPFLLLISDAPFLPAGAEILRALVGGATREPERMWRVTSDPLLAFFNTHLNGTPAPLLDDPSAAYPEVQFVDEDQ